MSDATFDFLSKERELEEKERAKEKDKDDRAFRWYSARLGFWQAMWGTIITGGFAVAIPAAVDSFRISQEIALKKIEIARKQLEADQQYVSGFLKAALDPDVEARIRFSRYFSYVSSEPYQKAWKEYAKEIRARRDQLLDEIDNKQMRMDELRLKNELTGEEQKELRKLQRELAWRNAELGIKEDR